MMQAFEQHPHTSFAYFLFMNAHGRKRRIHQNRFLTIVEAHQTNFVWHFHALSAQRTPKSVGDFVVAGHNGSRPRPPAQDSHYVSLTEVAEAQMTPAPDQDGFQFVLAHSLPVTFESAMKPRIGDISCENNLPVTLADQVTRGVKHAAEIVKAHLVELLPIVHSHHIVTEGNEGHLHGFDSAEQIRINGAG